MLQLICCSSVRPDDSGDGAGRGRERRFSVLCVEHIQIFQARTGVEEDNRIVSAEEAAA